MPFDDRLFTLLRELDDTELQTIWVDALKCSPEHEDFLIGSHELKVINISKEWRSAHGHTLLNLRRGSHELPWRRILIDVADKLKPGWGWSSFKMDGDTSDEEIERAILQYFDERAQEAWAKMSEAERDKLAHNLNQASTGLHQTTARSAIGAITASSLGAGIGAGLLSGAGAMAIAQGATGFALSGILMGSLYQLSFWIVVRVFGMWSGVQLLASGGLATAAGVLLSGPAVAVAAVNAIMATSYRKTIPATLAVLTAHELRRQLAELEGGK